MPEPQKPGNQPDPAKAASPPADPAPQVDPKLDEIQQQLSQLKQENDGLKKGMYEGFEKKAAAEQRVKDLEAKLAQQKESDATAEFIRKLAEESEDPEAMKQMGRIIQQMKAELDGTRKELSEVKLQTQGIAQRTLESIAAESLAKTGIQLPDSWRRDAVEWVRDHAGENYRMHGGKFEEHIAAAARKYADKWKSLGSHFTRGEQPPADTGVTPPPVPQGGAAPPTPPVLPKPPEIGTPEFHEYIDELSKNYMDGGGQ